MITSLHALMQRLSNRNLAMAATAWGVVVGSVLAMVGMVATGCSKPDEVDSRTGKQSVSVAEVRMLTSSGRTFTGVVVARVQSDMGFRVEGKVIERLVDAGQVVRQGQLLMRLDPIDLNLAVAARMADVVAAEARRDRTVAEEVRQKTLLARGATSAQTYDDAKAAADSAIAQLAAVQAAARIAENNGGYAELRAEFDGTVVDTRAEPGQVVSKNEVVIRLAKSGPREAAVNLPESVRPALESAATATVYGGEGHSSHATLRQLSNAADLLTRTYEARYVLEGNSAETPLGATVTIELPNLSIATQVPLAALTDRGQGPGVWVVNRESATVSFRSVKVKVLGQESAVIENGLQPGEQVVALGAHLLHDGEAVRVELPKVVLQ